MNYLVFLCLNREHPLHLLILLHLSSTLLSTLHYVCNSHSLMLILTLLFSQLSLFLMIIFLACHLIMLLTHCLTLASSSF